MIQNNDSVEVWLTLKKVQEIYLYVCALLAFKEFSSVEHRQGEVLLPLPRLGKGCTVPSKKELTRQ